MKTKYLLMATMAMFALLNACNDYPMDEDDLLITPQTECYIGNFFLYGSDHVDVLKQELTVIDTVNLTIEGVAKFGTNLKHVKPAASLSIDSKITPAMGLWTDFTQPRKYTVISGNREIKKEYTITIQLEGE
jgi:hypothetical protein